MAYFLTHFWPGGTAEQYRVTFETVTKAAGGKRPEQFHAGGPTEGGILIAAVYESKEACESFVRDSLLRSVGDWRRDRDCRRQDRR